MAEFKALTIKTIKRPWGSFRQFTQNLPSTVKIHTVKPGEGMSLQSHAKRSEFWHIISGTGVLEIGDIKYNIKEGDEHDAPVGVKHRLSAGPSGLVALEIALGDFDEDDEIRYEDKYGRA